MSKDEIFEEKKAVDQQGETGAREVRDDELDMITGGANPFANVSRVPNAKIDKNLRDKA